LDWGASQFLSKQWLVGAVGYVYNQLTGDSGSGDRVGPFESRVVGVGPQIGYIFPLGTYQGYVNLKGYGEFDAHDRPHGYNTWLTLSISPPAPTPPPSAVLTMPGYWPASICFDLVLQPIAAARRCTTP
jgi:Putative MetA-pathway of phenol degradation